MGNLKRVFLLKTFPIFFTIFLLNFGIPVLKLLEVTFLCQKNRELDEFHEAN